MRIFTPEECAEWCEKLQVVLDQQRRPMQEVPGKHRLRCRFPSSYTQLLWFSRCIESSLQPRRSCLLWVTEWGVFQDSQNEHLYYRLRQSYGDFRLLHEAPGHLCLDYESAELVTLIYVCILFGWDVHLIPTAGHGRVFISYHQWVEMGFSGAAQFEEASRALKQGGVDVFVPEAPPAG